MKTQGIVGDFDGNDMKTYSCRRGPRDFAGFQSRIRHSIIN